MTMLEKVKRGIETRPQRVIVYGPEGVGKTTLAATFPAPIFLDTEQGSGRLDVARLDCRTFSDVLEAVNELVKGGHEFKSVVIDSIDWCERLLTADFIRNHNEKNKTTYRSIEDFGYGKGYTMIAAVAMKFLGTLNKLIDSGLNVVLVGHSRRVKFEMPETAGAYDKHELNLTKGVAPLVKEWADAMLFCNFLVSVQDGKGKGGNARVVYTAPSAPYEAKNRHNMPDMMPMDGEIGKLLFGAANASQAVPKPVEAASEQSQPTPAPVQQAPYAGSDLEGYIDDMPTALKFMVHKGWIKEGCGFAAVPTRVADQIRTNAERFNQAVRLFKEGGAA